MFDMRWLSPYCVPHSCEIYTLINHLVSETFIKNYIIKIKKKKKNAICVFFFVCLGSLNFILNSIKIKAIYTNSLFCLRLGRIYV